ncbi:MAG: ABC transporter permease [Oscillospiraceae bacterium]|nr:ABC transporter permease [Oscillospiraceae bacterium]
MQFKAKFKPGNLLKKNLTVYFAFIAIFVFFSVYLGSTFLSVNNILNITRQTAMISVMAIGMTFVIGSGMIDLSIGSTTALSAMVVALVLRSTNNIFLGLIAGLAVGATVGAVNGFLVTKTKIPAFLTTLGTMQVVRGLAMRTTNNQAVPILNDDFTFIFGVGDIGGIPVLLFWTVFFAIIGYFLLNRFSFGRHVLATGGNEAATKFSGINTDWIKIKVMVLSGVLASFAGILYAGRLQAGRHTFGEGDELSVIAAVILGGTSIAGGNGSIMGAIIGSVLMGVINNGLTLAGLPVADRTIVSGAIIILATAITNRTKIKKAFKRKESDDGK